MVSQTLETHQIDAHRSSGRIDAILTPDRTPAINRTLIRARQMSPDELYNAGFRAGINGWGMQGSMMDSPQYQQGWERGRKVRF